jgi:transposase InsO family protein
MMYPLVRELAVDGIPVTVTCRVLGFSTQAYYKWRSAPVTDRDWSDAHLVNAARDVHGDDPAFGYRFIADELASEHGITASENRVARLCSAHGIFSVLARKAGRRPRPGEAVADDLVRRVFTAEVPNALWLVDITERLRRPWSPSSRMSLATRLRLVEMPWRWSSAWILGAP